MKLIKNILFLVVFLIINNGLMGSQSPTAAQEQQSNGSQLPQLTPAPANQQPTPIVTAPLANQQQAPVLMANPANQQSAATQPAPHPTLSSASATSPNQQNTTSSIVAASPSAIASPSYESTVKAKALIYPASNSNHIMLY